MGNEGEEAPLVGSHSAAVLAGGGQGMQLLQAPLLAVVLLEGLYGPVNHLHLRTIQGPRNVLLGRLCTTSITAISSNSIGGCLTLKCDVLEEVCRAVADCSNTALGLALYDMPKAEFL